MSENKQPPGSPGMNIGAVIGAVVGTLIWLLLLRTPQLGSGYLLAKDRLMMVLLAVVLGGVGTWLGERLGRRSKNTLTS